MFEVIDDPSGIRGNSSDAAAPAATTIVSIPFSRSVLCGTSQRVASFAYSVNKVRALACGGCQSVDAIAFGKAVLRAYCLAPTSLAHPIFFFKTSMPPPPSPFPYLLRCPPFIFYCVSSLSFLLPPPLPSLLRLWSSVLPGNW